MFARNRLVRSSSSLFMGAVLAFALACGPSTKGETQQWERNVAAVTELGAQWPGFKASLEAKQAAAQPAWDEALKVGDEEAKAAAMDAANDKFNPLLGKLQEVKSKSKSVEDTITKLNRLKLKKSNKAKRERLVDNARTALEEIQSAMLDAAPADDAAAVAIADEQISRLIGVASPLKAMLDKHTSTKKSGGKSKKGKK